MSSMLPMGFGGTFGGMFPEIPGSTFNETYRCYSVTMLGERESVNRGGKIIMPPSALHQLARLHIQYPMLFKMTNRRSNRETHCGVLEFVADEGRIYLPYWMMQNLALEEGHLVQIENVSLSVATFAKFQPQSVDFLDITNPKAVLENALRSFACLTTGDVVAIDYNDKIYELCVLETKPGNAVSIIECDMNVEFAAPVGYQEPNTKSQNAHEPDDEDMDVTDGSHDDTSFRAFCGEGNRLDGKQKNLSLSPSQTAATPIKRGIPNYNHKPGTLRFIRTPRPITTSDKDSQDFEAFSGEGQTLRKKGTRK